MAKEKSESQQLNAQPLTMADSLGVHIGKPLLGHVVDEESAHGGEELAHRAALDFGFQDVSDALASIGGQPRKVLNEDIGGLDGFAVALGEGIRPAGAPLFHIGRSVGPAEVALETVCDAIQMHDGVLVVPTEDLEDRQVALGGFGELLLIPVASGSQCRRLGT